MTSSGDSLASCGYVAVTPRGSLTLHEIAGDSMAYVRCGTLGMFSFYVAERETDGTTEYDQVVGDVCVVTLLTNGVDAEGFASAGSVVGL